MLYSKIPGPFKRNPETNKVMPGVFTTPELEALYDTPIWSFTEKINGMNMRAMWDGHEVTIGGRTDSAQIPGDLLGEMRRIFTEEKFEQEFGETPVVVFGEGYGAGIQKGGHYRDTKGFIGFDVAVGGYYLTKHDGLMVIQDCFGADVVPLTYCNSLREMVENYRGFSLDAYRGAVVPPEGFVGVTTPGLLDKRGHRIIVKVKGCDFDD